MPEPKTAAEYKAEQDAEWNVYVAIVPIDFNGHRSFNEGDKVPASHVARGVVLEEQVAKVTTKAGREAVAAAVPAVTEEKK